MKYKLKTSQFCALSRDKQWHDWLRDKADDLYDGLISHIKLSKSCRSNKEKMIEIRNELHGRSLDKPLYKFLRDVYPFVLQPIVEVDDNKKDTKISSESRSGLNKHKIFEIFIPYILTFPQKMILADSSREALLSRVRKFTKNKISTDYLVVEDRAYIEYFDTKYSRESSKVPVENWELYQFKLKHGLIGRFEYEP